MKEHDIVGQTVGIVRNRDGANTGELVAYYQALWTARNVNHPYHNYRHTCHVLWLCHSACLYYNRVLTTRQRRNLLIAAIFHDFNHTGIAREDDRMNIDQAVSALREHITEEDRPELEKIIGLIAATEYPHGVPSEKLELSAQILRDADMAQGLTVSWIQQVVYGLAAERGVSPTEMMKAQIPYYVNLRFHTDWAKSIFPAEMIKAKIAEVQEHLDLLSMDASVVQSS